MVGGLNDFMRVDRIKESRATIEAGGWYGMWMEW